MHGRKLSDSPHDPATLAVLRLQERYPSARLDDAHSPLREPLRAYLLSLADIADDDSSGVRLLSELTERVDDPGAAALLLGDFLIALQECGLDPTIALQSKAMRHLAQVSRRGTESASARAESRAHTDPASGLPNRNALYRHARECMQQAQADGMNLGALCVDLRHTARMLGQPGHATHEELILAVTSRLQNALRPQDILGRSSEPEFSVLLPGLRSPGQAMLAANKVAACLAEPLALRQDQIELSHAIGIASFPDHTESAESLLNCARTAARAARRNGVHFMLFNGRPDCDDDAMRALEADLRIAMSKNALRLHFQPQLDLRTSEVLIAEALLRWERTPGEWTQPEQIIACAEAAGLMSALSLWTLNAALQQLDAWSRAGLDIKVGINISATSLKEDDLPELVALQLASWGVSPQRLLLEITEGSVIDDMERSLSILQRLKSIGVSISMDDFGTGHSSLKSLRELPLNELKIDRRFVKDMLSSPEDEIIVQAVIDLAHNFNLRVVAEGVEDLPTQEALARMGCDQIQGFGLSRPLAPEQCKAFFLLHQQNG